MANRREKVEAVPCFIFLSSKITVDGDCSNKIKRCLILGKEAIANLDSMLVSRDIVLLSKVCIGKAMCFLLLLFFCFVLFCFVFSSSHIWVWDLDHKEHLKLNDWCYQTVVFVKTLGSPLDSKEIITLNPKGDLPWIFTGSNDSEAPIFWPPDENSKLIGKDPDSGKYWRSKKKEVAKD